MKNILAISSSSPSSSHSHFILILLCLYTCLYTQFVSSQCLDDQKSLLLELKNNLTFETFDYGYYFIPHMLMGWNESTDCCQWGGVHCDKSSGHVIGLDLSSNNIFGGIDNSSSLFRLQFLQSLNLANNKIKGEIPSAIGKLSSLTYLNLSNAGFTGQVPFEISLLVKLLVLDISSVNDRPYMKRPNLKEIIRNMNDLRELYLDGVDNSAMGKEWGRVLSSSLPHLQVLSMSSCSLRGGIHNSLSKIRHLSVINLYPNNLEGPIPEFLVQFTNLTSLSLCCNFTGKMPWKIFQVPSLKTLVLSGNEQLEGSIPTFYKNGSLEELDLSDTSFSGVVPSSISNLKSLRKIDLSDCQFHGSIPSSIERLILLEYLDLSDNQFSGPTPSFSSTKNLKWLNLYGNNLNGSITATEWETLVKLEYLGLANNSLDGSIPMSMFSLPTIRTIELEQNNFSGKLTEFVNIASSQLSFIDLSNNNLEGPIPIRSFFQLEQLEFLELYSNRFTGTLKLGEILHNFKDLEVLDLSHNYLSIDADGVNVTVNSSSSNLRLVEVRLASCNMSIVPEILRYLSSLYAINLSNNHILGRVPRWICNATSLQLINLEYNHFSGTIPDCLFNMTGLQILNLRGNHLGGVILAIETNSSLETLDLNGNLLQGKVPLSLANYTSLEVLDLGYNQLYDTFPCHLESLSKLQVLILRSNSLHGSMVCPGIHSTWPQLQIIDVASNHFSGELTAQMFLKLTSMMVGTLNSKVKYWSYYTSASEDYYEDAGEITFKGYTYRLEKSLGFFIVMDLSNNDFHGELPRELGNLNALLVLNFSHNSLYGNIPSSLGNLSHIESLDLSCNSFSGKIPPQLANLNFLEHLNLSYNKLSGEIPTGTQLQSFSASSYEGNQGLYGPPLTPTTTGSEPDPPTSPSTSPQGSNWSSKNQIEWMVRGAEVGFPVGIIIFLGPLLYIKKWRECYCKYLDKLVMRILRKEDNRKGQSRKQRPRR